MKISIITLILFLFAKEIEAQIPLADPTFSITHQDAFSTSTLSPQWGTNYPWGTQYNNGSEWNVASNILLTYTTGYLAIKCETMAPLSYTTDGGIAKTATYQSGVITSTWSAKYGYFEISAKMPVGKGYWPAFWLYNQAGCQWYNEIDIAENGGLTSITGTKMGFNMLWFDPATTCTSCSTCVGHSLIGDGTIPLDVSVPGYTGDEHKYAMFWEPNKVTYFYDDSPVYSVVNSSTSIIPDHGLRTMINFAIEPVTSGNPPGPGTTFPAYFQVNYFKLWQLVPDCSTAETFCSNFNPTTYVSKVKKSISIGGSGCSDNINTSSNINFWATDFVLLDAGTTITDNGSGGFSINMTVCPN